jgi:hypothetical protein
VLTNRQIYYIVTGRKAPRRSPRKRRGPARNWKYRGWIRTQPCCACGSERDVQAAHTVNNGMASKGPDTSCVPLCVPCHREYDSGLRSGSQFEADNGIEMAGVVETLNRAWGIE